MAFTNIDKNKGDVLLKEMLRKNWHGAVFTDDDSSTVLLSCLSNAAGTVNSLLVYELSILAFLIPKS